MWLCSMNCFRDIIVTFVVVFWTPTNKDNSHSEAYVFYARHTKQFIRPVSCSHTMVRRQVKINWLLSIEGHTHFPLGLARNNKLLGTRFFQSCSPFGVEAKATDRSRRWVVVANCPCRIGQLGVKIRTDHHVFPNNRYHNSRTVRIPPDHENPARFAHADSGLHK